MLLERGHVRAVRFVWAVAVFLLLVSVLGSHAFAGPAPALPEIDPGSATSALTLLFGGLLVLAHRGRRQ
jgi:hypothetical protein